MFFVPILMAHIFSFLFLVDFYFILGVGITFDLTKKYFSHCSLKNSQWEKDRFSYLFLEKNLCTCLNHGVLSLIQLIFNPAQIWCNESFTHDIVICTVSSVVYICWWFFVVIENLIIDVMIFYQWLQFYFLLLLKLIKCKRKKNIHCCWKFL